MHSTMPNSHSVQLRSILRTRILVLAAHCNNSDQSNGSRRGTNVREAKERKSFKFRHFSVYHDRCAMKVGTDAMLLGSWAPPPPPRQQPPRPLSPTAPPPQVRSTRRRILDVGTGTGVLALMMAQKTAAAVIPAAAEGPSTQPEALAAAEATVDAGVNDESVHILAIDVDAGACAQAQENVALSPWAARIQVLQCSLQELAAAAAAPASVSLLLPPSAATLLDEGAVVGAGQDSDEAGSGMKAVPGRQHHHHHHDHQVAQQQPELLPADVGLFDLIISNPPYFVESSKPAQGRAARAAARHADVSLPFTDLAAGCAALLAPGGNLCVVLPPVEAQRFCAVAAAHGLTLVERVRVFTAPEDARERRHLMRLQRAVDLAWSPTDDDGTGAAATLAGAAAAPPKELMLFINGPKVARSGVSQVDSGAAEAKGAAAQQRPPRPQVNTTDTGAVTDRPVEGPEQGVAASSPSPSSATATATSTSSPSTAYDRRLTAAYVALTADFHPPEFLAPYTQAPEADSSSSNGGCAPPTLRANP